MYVFHFDLRAHCDIEYQVSLRWRTEEEVLSGVGETTCGNTRCKHHDPVSDSSTAKRRWDDDAEAGKSARKGKERKLVTLELPFSYVEDNTQKSALVKVVLCERCVRKLNWKRERMKEGQGLAVESVSQVEVEDSPSRRSHSPSTKRTKDKDSLRKREKSKEGRMNEKRVRVLSTTANDSKAGQ